MEPRRCISVRRTGRRPYHSCTKVARGISTPTRASRRFYTAGSAGTNYQRFAFARNSWRRRKTIGARSPRSMQRKSRAMQGGATVYIGRRRRASAAGEQSPYRGYYFHILTQQGKHAPGGAKSYIANGKMTEGFAFVAYPAEYRSSGVMTFIR